MSLPAADGSQPLTYSLPVAPSGMTCTTWPPQTTTNTSRAHPYKPYWQAAMAAIHAGFPSGVWDPIAWKMVPLWKSQWAAIQCHPRSSFSDWFLKSLIALPFWATLPPAMTSMSAIAFSIRERSLSSNRRMR